MQIAIGQMDKAKAHPKYVIADMTFHRLIAQATKNEIVAHIVHDLTDLLQQSINEVHADRLMTSRSGTPIHQEMLNAITQQNGSKVAALMREHLSFAKEMWQTVVTLGAVSA